MCPLSSTSKYVNPRSVCVVPSAPTPSTMKLSFAIGVWKPCMPPHVMLSADALAEKRCADGVSDILLDHDSRPGEAPLVRLARRRSTGDTRTLQR